MCRRHIYTVPKRHIYSAKKTFYLSIKKKILKVEFRLHPYKALLERFLKSDEKMVFGTNALDKGNFAIYLKLF